MAFYFQSEDSRISDLIDPLQYSLADTCEDLYQHVQNQLGHPVKLLIDEQLLHPYRKVDQFFPEGDYNIMVFRKENQEDDNIQILCSIDSKRVCEIQADNFYKLGTIVQGMEIALNRTIQTYALYDSNGVLLSTDPNVRLIQFLESPQPFHLNVDTIQEEIKSENGSVQKQSSDVSNPQLIQIQIYVNGIQVSETAQEITSTIEAIVQTVEIPSDQIIQSYKLYDSNGIQLIDENTNAQLADFQNQQPLLIDISTDIQQISQDNVPVINTEKKALDLMKQILALHRLQLFMENQGDFIIYTFHKPILVKGFLRKDRSKPKPLFKKEKFKWIQWQSVKVAEIGDYAFAVEWDNGNISKVELQQI